MLRIHTRTTCLSISAIFELHRATMTSLIICIVDLHVPSNANALCYGHLFSACEMLGRRNRGYECGGDDIYSPRVAASMVPVDLCNPPARGEMRCQTGTRRLTAPRIHYLLGTSTSLSNLLEILALPRLSFPRSLSLSRCRWDCR